MKIAGVVVEYNPLHNGHLYHLQQTRKKIKPDLLIAVMSGNFLQRGEPAILSKWRRAEFAIKAGIDLVIELPYAYATQKAQVFAWGAVSLLHALGTTDLCFGSEEGQIEVIDHTYELLNTHHSAYQQTLKKLMKEGLSFPKAQSLAFQSLALNPDETADLSKPNNILGFHYVEASHKLEGALTCHTIQRTGANYHDSEIGQASIASATAIRRHLLETNGEWEDLEEFVPFYTAEALRDAARKEELRSWEDYFPFLKYRILTDSNDDLFQIYEAEEGLENRLKKAIDKADSYAALMKAIKTKRYTWTRLQRFLTHVLTQTTKADLSRAYHLEKPNYIRLLGMSERGQQYLNQKKEPFSIPLISRVGKEEAIMLERDLIAAKCYQIVPTSEKNEFQQSPIRMQNL